MKLVYLVAAALLVILVVGCENELHPKTLDLTVAPDGRFEVTRVGVFDDPLAYNNKRGIYVIRDKSTGTEFVGISGIGISETGSHSQTTGKVTTKKSDER